jgi:phospholipid/cholesterol/gamma-HCH transport system substrate-binding protein
MKRNIIETVIGAIVLCFAVGFVVIAFRAGSVASSSGYEVIAEFDNASGLAPGSEVRMSGVKIGTVARQSLNPETFFAVISMNIDAEIELPMDSSARILADGLLGGSYVAVEPGGDEETIGPGGNIEFTQGAINMVDLLGRFIFSTAEQADKAK